MLQQTRVGTVIPYYQAWLCRFPAVRELAEASVDDVLKVWEGLGYYRRARHLHLAAKHVMERFGGVIPSAAAVLRTLPGIGESTAGAIASIAFAAREPVLDGNVKRILCRLFLIGDSPDRPQTLRELWRIARRLLPDREAGVFNEALMDLGAMVCLPGNPACGRCPVSNDCLAREHAAQNRVPVKAGRRNPLPHYELAVGLIWKGDRLLIERRGDDAMLGGLWEFPGGRMEPGETPAECLVREVREGMGAVLRDLSPFMTVKQAYSHFRITMHVIESRYVRGCRGKTGCTESRWAAPGELDRYAFDTASGKVIRKLAEIHQ
jgi:A/G-specific adenine glycosylase